MRNEGFESTVMVSGNPIHAESAERRTHTTQMIFVHIRFVAELINRREVILHTLASVVAADLFIPLLAEARQAAAVRRHDDVVACTHHHEVPSK